MSAPAILVDNLSKRYVIGHQRPGGEGLRHVLQEKITAPLRWLRSGGKKADDANAPAFANREDFWALKDVSLEIQQGEVLGIIGRNGAGKSTLLKILSRITEPTRGRITLRGRVASLLEVGTGFHPELTGRENIFLNGAILGMTRQDIKRQFDAIVAFAEVEQFIDTPVKRYSSGMYVRLAFAVAAHLQTDILVVDEVLAVGDMEFQKKCLGKMQDIASGQGRTVLFVSHQLGAIRRLCTAACLLKSGGTEGITTVDAALNQYSANLTESPFDLDLAQLPRRDGLGECAKILNLRIPPESSLQYGEPLTLLFTLHCLTPVNNITLGFGFDTLDGARVLTRDSDNTAPPLNLGAGCHEIRFHIERNPLHPSTYTCGAAIMAGTHVLDAVLHCTVWEVSPSRLGIEIIRGFSGCRIPVEVTASPLPGTPC